MAIAKVKTKTKPARRKRTPKPPQDNALKPRVDVEPTNTEDDNPCLRYVPLSSGHRQLITERRREKGWTQKDLAEKLDVSMLTVTLWETGNMCPKEAKLKLLCKLLGLEFNVSVIVAIYVA